MQLDLQTIFWCAGLLSALACGDTERNDKPVMEAPEEGIWSPIPEECVGLSNPYLEENCLQALHLTCRSKTTEQNCAAQGKALVGSREISCTWVPVVTYHDGDSCVVESVSYRCEAWLNPQQLAIPCFDPCEVESDLWSAWHAIPGDRELLKICGPPVGPWLGAAGEEWEGYSFTCLDNGTPAPPPLCACTAIACTAVAGSLGAAGAPNE